jgi:hypothetical protein
LEERFTTDLVFARWLIAKKVKEKELRLREVLVLTMASLGSKDIQKVYKEYVQSLFPELEEMEKKELENALDMLKKLMNKE